jgi:curli biogenesis system outer membrane secretion channel CsgG
MKGHGGRNILTLLALAGLAMGMVGCESLLEPQAAVTGGAGGPSIGQAQAEHYNGPKARIAVLAFDNKTGKGHQIGDGMADMLATALFDTGRYIVLERRELGGVLAEQDLARSGRVRPDASIPTGQVEGAELLVTGAITEFEPNYQGGSLGVVLPNAPLGVGATGKQAHIGIDMRVIDARTSRIVAATSITGRSTDLAGALGTVIGGGSTLTGIGLGAYRNTPVEKAVRVCIIKAVQFIVSRTPQHYYHYNAMNQPTQPGGYGGPPAMPAPGQPGQPPQPAPPGGATLPPVGPQGAAPTQPATPQAAPPQAAQPAQPAEPAAQPAPAGGGDLPGKVYVSLASARVFEKPDASSSAVATVSKGAELAVAGQQGNWYAVALPDGTSGWVLKSFTSTTP